MKICKRCKQEMPPEGFYCHKEMSDGRLNICKTCVKISASANRAKSIDKYRAYDRARGARMKPDYIVKYRGRYPQKYKAVTAVNNAVRSGRLLKGAICETCGSKNNIVAHHHDYLLPLSVIWLCQACHCKWHAEHGEALNGNKEQDNE